MITEIFDTYKLIHHFIHKTIDQTFSDNKENIFIY